MPRLRPRTTFTAAFVVVAACGGGSDAPFDAGDYGTENPPCCDADIDSYISENPPPVCDYAADPQVGCNECFVGLARHAGESDCTSSVCSTDPYCCETAWDEACVDRADATCEQARCTPDLTLGGTGQITLAARVDAGFEASAWTAADATPIRSLAWADFDRDSDADAAVVTDCSVRIERNNDWAIPASTPVFEAAPIAGCAGLPEPQRWGGRRARWADVDGDHDLDLVVAGRAGVVVIERGVTGFALGDTVMSSARGAATDVAIADLDGDDHLDAIVSIEGVGTRAFRHTATGWAEDESWTGPVAAQLELCSAADRVLAIANGSLTLYRLGDTGVGAAIAGPFPDAGTLVTCIPGGVATADAGASPVRVFDASGQVWSSVDDLEPDVLIDASAIEVGLVAGNDTIFVASSAADAPLHVFTRDVFPAFTHATVPDLVPDDATTAVEPTALARPPR